MMIELTQGKRAVVDDCHADKCKAHRWWAVRTERNFYAQARIAGRNVYLHRWLFGHLGRRLDHKNGDGLDNRQENVRPASHAQNMANKRKQQWKDGRETVSQFKGVYRNRKRWQARIEHDGQATYLGSFRTEWEAATAYNLAAAQYFGTFACENEMPR